MRRVLRLVLLGYCVWFLQGNVWASELRPKVSVATDEEDKDWESVELADQDTRELQGRLEELRQEMSGFSISDYITAHYKAVCQRIEYLENILKQREADENAKRAAVEEQQRKAAEEQKRLAEQKAKEEQDTKQRADLAAAYTFLGLDVGTVLTDEVWEQLEKRRAEMASKFKHVGSVDKMTTLTISFTLLAQEHEQPMSSVEREKMVKEDAERRQQRERERAVKAEEAAAKEREAEARRKQEEQVEAERNKAERERADREFAEGKARQQAEEQRRQKAAADEAQQAALKQQQDRDEACKVLGVAWGDTLTKRQVKVAFDKKAILWHPDKWNGQLGVDRAAGEAMYKQLLPARDLLYDLIQARDQKS